MTDGGSYTSLRKLRTFKEDFLRAQENKTNTVTTGVLKKEPDSKTLPPITKKIPSPAPEKIPEKKNGISKIPKPTFDVSEIKTESKESILTTHDDVFDVSDASHTTGEGTIITDTKDEKFHLLSEIFRSTKKWFTNKKGRFIQETTTQPTVIPAERRADVIVAAAQKRTLAPKDDFIDVKKHLATIKRSEHTANLTFKDARAVEDPTWSHYDGDGTTPTAIKQPEEERVGDLVLETNTTEEPAPIKKQTPTRLFAAPAHNVPSPFIFVVVSVVAVILGISFTFWFLKSDTNVITQTKIIPAKTIITTAHAEVFLTSRASLFLNKILGTPVSTVEKITQIQPVIENTGDSATIEEILAVLNLQAPGNFIRGITNIEFGKHTSTSPFIVIEVTSFDVALSGMLAWEKTISGDLTPLLGDVVQGTFDPRARTASQIREPFFVDVLHANRDIRVLRDALQTDRISYTLLNSNTILITTDRNSLEMIAPLIHH